MVITVEATINIIECYYFITTLILGINLIDYNYPLFSTRA